MSELSPDQLARIRYLLYDEWVVDEGNNDDDVVSQSRFSEALDQMSALELHYFACNFNWDCGIDELNAVIEHPACDAGTALTIYWLGQPATCYRMELRGQLSSDAQRVVAMLRKIETKFAAGLFKSCDFVCDPFNLLGQPATTGSERDRLVVPEAMFQKVGKIDVTSLRF